MAGEVRTQEEAAFDTLPKAFAEIERLRKENDWLRAYTGQSAKECIYCGLGAQNQALCASGFPGCARADDQMLCREVAVGMERDHLRKERDAALERQALILQERDATRNECNRYWRALVLIESMTSFDQERTEHWGPLQEIAHDALYGDDIARFESEGGALPKG